MYDATPLQVIAHGFVPAPTGVGPVTGAFVEGVSLVNRTVPGVTQIFLDTGLPGGGTVALEDIRILITPQAPQGLLTFPVTVDAVALEATPPPVGPGGTLIAVRTWDLALSPPVLVDNGYWFEIKRPAQSET